VSGFLRVSGPRLPAALVAALAGALCVFAQEEADRRSPVVQAVQKAAPAVVIVSTEMRVENPFHGSFLRSFLGSLFEKDQDEESGEEFLGSGILVDVRGYVLTNEHVVLRASRINVTLPDKRKLAAEVVGTDPSSDLAVLELEGGAGFPVLALGRSSDLMAGETVIAVGNTPDLGSTVTTGVVSAVKRSVKVGDRRYNDFIQTDASINSSNSGGPLLNIKGEVIGVNTAIQSPAQGVGFAIPADRARKVYEDLIRYGEVRLAWLGLDVRSVDVETMADGIQFPAGAAVRRAYPGSPADKAGLAAGDVIVRLGGLVVSNHEDFDAAVSRLKTGDTVAINYSRGGAQRVAVLTASEFPPALSELFLDDQIGIEVTDIPPALRAQTQVLPRDGVIVTRVRARSPAAATGLEEGDVIRQVNNIPVRDMAGLREAIPRLAGRPSLLLKVARGRFSYYAALDLD